MTSHVTCLGCGCACDDIDVVVSDERIVEARQACSLGAAWFGDGRVPARALVSGRHTSIDAALDAAADALGRGAHPFVYLAPELSCEAQREGIALADALRASVDSVTSDTVRGSILAAQERGEATATLGEVRNRADVVLFWGVDPDVAYPRFRTRYAPDPTGAHLPDGRASRTVVAVDVDDLRGPADANARVAMTAADEVAALTMLAAGQGQIAPIVRGGRYVAIVADGEPQPGRDAGRTAALIAAAQALNGFTRCALIMLRAGGNRSGADAGMTSQTGYPIAVDFSRGAPRYRPFEDTAGVRLARGTVDAMLVLGAVASVPPSIASRLSRVPLVLIGPRASASALAGAATAVVDTGIAGIHEGGTALRMDDVPLPLRPSIAGPPSAVSVARTLRQRLAVGAR